MDEHDNERVANILREVCFTGSTVIKATELLLTAQTIIIQEAEEEDRGYLAKMIDVYLGEKIYEKFGPDHG